MMDLLVCSCSVSRQANVACRQDDENEQFVPRNILEEILPCIITHSKEGKPASVFLQSPHPEQSPNTSQSVSSISFWLLRSQMQLTTSKAKSSAMVSRLLPQSLWTSLEASRLSLRGSLCALPPRPWTCVYVAKRDEEDVVKKSLF